MKSVFNLRQAVHDLRRFIACGMMLPNPEMPARIGVLQAGAEAAGCCGTADAGYLATLAEALQANRSFGADVIVEASGLEAYGNDPLKGLQVTTAGFSRIAAAIAATRLLLPIARKAVTCPMIRAPT